MLKTLQERDQVLLLEHFHSHWHLKRDGAPQLLLEPRQRIEQILQSSRIPKQSTTREPSAFKAVERAAAPRAVSRCSKCGAFGHIRTSKVCPQRYSELLQQSATQPVIQPATQPVIQPVIQPIIQPTIQPGMQPTITIQPAVQPAIQPAVQPTIQLTVQPVIQPVIQPAIQSVIQSAI